MNHAERVLKKFLHPENTYPLSKLAYSAKTERLGIGQITYRFKDGSVIRSEGRGETRILISLAPRMVPEDKKLYGIRITSAETGMFVISDVREDRGVVMARAKRFANETPHARVELIAMDIRSATEIKQG